MTNSTPVPSKLTVVKIEAGKGFQLSGIVDETIDFAAAFGMSATSAAAMGTIRLHCKDVQRINSVGVKNWIRYFQEISKAGASLVFAECSPAITEQLNLISNFSCGGTVESVYVPYACTVCKNEMIALFSTEELKQRDLELPELPCSKCGSKALFDDVEEEYFHFLDHTA